MTKYRAEGYKKKLESIVEPMKLRLKAEKTHIINAENQTFDFLGFTFAMKPSRRTGKMVVYYFPSTKAVNAIKGKVRRVVNHRRQVKVEAVIEELTPVLRGWVNYYRMANSSKKFGKVRYYVAQKVRKFMRRHEHKSGYGYKKYPDEFLYGKLGLYRDYRVTWAKAF